MGGAGRYISRHGDGTIREGRESFHAQQQWLLKQQGYGMIEWVHFHHFRHLPMGIIGEATRRADKRRPQVFLNE